MVNEWLVQAGPWCVCMHVIPMSTQVFSQNSSVLTRSKNMNSVYSERAVTYWGPVQGVFISFHVCLEIDTSTIPRHSEGTKQARSWMDGNNRFPSIMQTQTLVGSSSQGTMFLMISKVQYTSGFWYLQQPFLLASLV